MNVKDTILTPHPGRNPISPVVWPGERHVRNQVQQTKGSAKPEAALVLPSSQPSQAIVPPRTTPSMVSHVRVVTKAMPNNQKRVTVQFNHPGDPYFAGASIYLRRGRNQPVLVASGSQSPLTFTTDRTNEPHSVHVTSTGNWGETDILKSPAARVRLA